jgi:hypothetical protein
VEQDQTRGASLNLLNRLLNVNSQKDGLNPLKNGKNPCTEKIVKMADFCMECSMETFGEDFKDFAGLITKRDYEEKHLAMLVLCEGCGAIYVDHEGKRIEPKGN